MDIRHLRTFITVARLGSITKAAEALHITQPAVSGQLKSLEEELSIRLLSRTTSSVELTQAGSELLASAERALEAFGEFRNRAKALCGQIEGALRIGLTMIDPEQMRMGAFMRALVTAHPALQIRLQANRIGWLLEALKIGEIDCALYVGREVPPNLEGLHLTKLIFRLVAPTTWKARLDGATLGDAALMPWIRTTRPSANNDMVTEILREASIKPVEVVEADHELVIRSLVCAGLGIGLIREDLALQAAACGEVILFGDHKAATNLFFVFATSRSRDPVIIAALEALKKTWDLPQRSH